MTAPSTSITTGISLRGAFVSEKALDTASDAIIGLGQEMNGSSFGVDAPVPAPAHGMHA